MILKSSLLNVKVGQESDFENAFQRANLEDQTVGFRQSESYQQWKSLLHHFYEPFPTEEHYERII